MRAALCLPSILTSPLSDTTHRAGCQTIGKKSLSNPGAKTPFTTTAEPPKNSSQLRLRRKRFSPTDGQLQGAKTRHWNYAVRLIHPSFQRTIGSSNQDHQEGQMGVKYKARMAIIFRMLAAAWLVWAWGTTGVADETGLEFFEKKVRPVLVEHCYKCHSVQSKELKGGLQLDLKAGWQRGGDSGEPAVIPGKPDESPLIRAIRHDDEGQAMPPDQPRLPDAVIADLVAWVKSGAADPRDGELKPVQPKLDWETVYQDRLKWWSLQPVATVEPPAAESKWPRNEVDRFILAGLSAQQLQPVAEAERRTLARRLSFALTGLPPSVESVERFLADTSPEAYETYVQSLLDSPHFGEHWARHWMDVVHYSDTHGYEWDAPAKNAWMYRDYLTRSFNADVPYDRFVLEQIAGDLIEPRIDPQTGLNEALVAPMALRLGERRHGDSAAADGVSQEAVSNVIDTLGKGFLGTTLACAQCHDHKLDAVEQNDYYALAGVFMSTRWQVRTVDAADPNTAALAELRTLKQKIRQELATCWLSSKDELATKLADLPADEKAAAAFPNSLITFWQRMKAAPLTAEAFNQERERRIAENKANLKLVADFTQADGAGGWRWEGWGMEHGLVRDGEIVVPDSGDAAIAQILPAGRWSHAWSPRLAGALRSPLFPRDAVKTISIRLAAGQHAAYAFILDQAFHSERMQFLNQPAPTWVTLTAGNFDTLEGSIDKIPRRVYLDLSTKSLNNYFPPRYAYGGLSEADIVDPRSWLGATQVYEHPPGKPPLDELTRFAPLVTDGAEITARFVNLLHAAVDCWSRDECTSDDAALLDEALRAKLLPADLQATPALAQLVADYRAAEQRLQPDRTIGSAADWNDGRNERLAIRGSYTDFGEEVPRGNARLLNRLSTTSSIPGSGRLELARSIASEKNPLTARVYVNRVWLHLFGEGLVRTPDDFGHLGQQPSHPELLDYLAARFMREGWSTKKLITLLVTSSTWRQSSIADPQALEVDPENRLWHHLPMRRLEAEAIRDSLLAVSGRLDPALFGPPSDPYRTAQDPTKRLLSGPLDGNGRRSLYTKITLMEPPRLLALFNQPLPKLTVGKRDVTNVPDQALALLNDPFVVAMAKHWSEQVLNDGATTPEQRAERMFLAAFARPPQPAEVERLVHLARRSAELRKPEPDALMTCQPVWQDVAHAMFNLKEFVYVQ